MNNQIIVELARGEWNDAKALVFADSGPENFLLLRGEEDKIVLVFHGQDDGTFPTDEVRQWAEVADVIVCCHPRCYGHLPYAQRFVFPDVAEEVFVGNWYGDLRITFHPVPFVITWGDWVRRNE